MLRDDRQRRFALARARGLNQLEAAREAGYSGSDATLKVTGSRLMKNPAVLQAIEEVGAQAATAADAPEDPELAPKLRAFVDALLGGKSAAAAARAAGYAAKTAPALLARADVRAALEAGRAKQEAAAIAQAREQQVILSAIARNRKVKPDSRIKAIVALHRIQAVRPKDGAPGGGTNVVASNVFVVVDNGRGPGHG